MTTHNYGKGGAGIDGLRQLECRTAIQRGWLALEFGESQIVSEDRGCRPGRLGKCIG
jgi:hypothetical protein